MTQTFIDRDSLTVAAFPRPVLFLNSITFTGSFWYARTSITFPDFPPKTPIRNAMTLVGWGTPGKSRGSLTITEVASLPKSLESLTITAWNIAKSLVSLTISGKPPHKINTQARVISFRWG